ncbi:hypothetical protein [Streptomyces sp. NPDC019937]|uniref:hypothetical protein n=1 Tax=Streptomyces sp. NPDC019937 TaxID=3154787 RepID=UPI0033FA0ADA
MAGRPRIEDLLSAVPISVSEVRQAVGGFEGGTADMVLASIRAAERAFAELDRCDAVIDRAAEKGAAAADRLQRLLEAEDQESIPGELAGLEAVAGEVRSGAETRRLMNRALGRDEAAEWAGEGVARLTVGELPVVPSLYDDDTDYADLMAMAGREEELKPRLRAVHDERIGRVATHLVAVVRQAAKSGFAHGEFARESLREAGRAYGLWGRCLAERKRDLG